MKKLLLGLGILPLAILPMMSVISCSTNTEGGIDGLIPPKPIPPLPSPDVNDAIFGKETPTIEKLKEYFTKPADLVAADKAAIDEFKAIKDLTIDRELLKTKYTSEYPSTRISPDLYLQSIRTKFKTSGYEINNNGYIVNVEHNYMLDGNVYKEIGDLTAEDQLYYEDANNWKLKPEGMNQNQFDFDAKKAKREEEMKIWFAPIVSYSDWTLSRMGELKIINPAMSIRPVVLIGGNRENIFVTDKGELGAFVVDVSALYKVNVKMHNFLNNLGPDKPNYETWTDAEKQEGAKLLEESNIASLTLIHSTFQKSKPLSITNSVEVDLITFITLQNSETTIESINNATTLDEKLNLFNIEYRVGSSDIIKDIKAELNSTNDMVLTLTYVDFISDTAIIGPFTEVFPNELKLYSHGLSPWEKVSSIFTLK